MLLKMFSKSVFSALVSIALVLQDGGQTTELSSPCKERKPIVPITMTQLSGSPWYVAANVNATSDEKHVRCVTTNYIYNDRNGEFIDVKTSIPEGSDGTVVTETMDAFNNTPGVFDLVLRDREGVNIRLTYLEFTLNESFVSAHCETRDGKLYTDRLSVAFKTQNVDPEKILEKLRSIGIYDFTNVWIVNQTNCQT